MHIVTKQSYAQNCILQKHRRSPMTLTPGLPHFCIQIASRLVIDHDIHIEFYHSRAL